MNLNTIAKPNTKGQIVIPKRFRDELNIDENVFLSIMLKGGGVFISPLEKSLVSKDSRSVIVNILKKTAGAWAGYGLSVTEQRRRKVELASTRENRNAKW